MRVCGFTPLDAAEPTEDDDQSPKPDMAVNTWITDRTICSSEQSTLIDSIRPVVTPHGRAAIFINTSGHYLLAQDLVLPGAPIIIDASDVTLDLNGYSLSCSGVCEQMVYAPTDGQLRLKNGMIRGGVTTFSAINTFRLSLQDLYLECTDTPNCYAISAFGVHTVDIYAVIVKGIENSALISARGGSITGSVFQAVEDGLSAVFAEGALIQSNLFRADVALELSGDNIVTHNAIASSSFGIGITMLGGRSIIRRNFIDARGGIAIALHDGNHIIADNNIDGGGILIGAGNNEIMGNMLIDAQMLNESNFAISVLSMGNTLAENLIVRHRCGLMFAAGDNSYRDNIALAVEEGVCGQENIDTGGNLFPTPTCGNHLRGVTEVCDGSDLGFQSCESLGFSRGNLGCSTMCDAYDTSGCVP
jgi:hypothetical protein